MAPCASPGSAGLALGRLLALELGVGGRGRGDPGVLEAVLRGLWTWAQS